MVNKIPTRRVGGSFDIISPQPIKPHIKTKSSSIKIKFAKHKKLIIIGLIVLILFGTVIGWLLVAANNKDKNGTKLDLNNVSIVQTKVSQHYLLPESETPALATITDPSKLTTEFLRQTKEGDKLLIYQKAQVVIVYRPSIDRIVKVGPVQIAELKNE